jgi:hypothetical protein
MDGNDQMSVDDFPEVFQTVSNNVIPFPREKSVAPLENLRAGELERVPANKILGAVKHMTCANAWVQHNMVHLMFTGVECPDITLIFNPGQLSTNDEVFVTAIVGELDG